jgi:peroxiredoxin
MFSKLSVLSAFAVVMGVAMSAMGEAQIGKPAPEWTATCQEGKSHKLSDFAGKIVVLEWFNDQCPYVVKHYSGGHMNKLAKKYMDKGVVWLAVNSSNFTTNEANAKIAGEWKIERPILNDASGQIGKAYGAKTTPHMFIIDKEGKLAYMGAIDSDSSSDSSKIDGATNYVAKALDELLAGQSVSEPQTKAYGCSVKYAK